MHERVKELDGIRGIAILAVIALHVFSQISQFTQRRELLLLAQASGSGWAGVDMFFTLSGFLIASILLQAKGREHYFRNFYARRILRILPLYLVTLIVAFVFFPYFEADFRSGFVRSLPALLTFTQNWMPVFMEEIPLSPYLWVTWSLAVEEQFYLILPLAVYTFNRQTLLKLGGAYVLVSAVARILGVAFLTKIANATTFSFFYYNSFTRFDELIAGALLAVLATYAAGLEQIRKYSLPAFATSLVVCVAIAAAAYPDPTFPTFGNVPVSMFGYPAIACLTAGLIGICLTHPADAPLRRLLRAKPLLFCGKYSYSMYLFHVPLALALAQIFQRSGLLGAEIALAYIAAAFAATILVALLTWNLLEKRALGLKKYFEYEPANGQ